MRKIRPAEKSDLKQIQQIISSGLRKCVLHSDEHFDPLYTEICNDLDWALENQTRCLFWVAEEDDTIQGVVMVKEFWNLSAMFVDPACHRTGIARARWC